MKRIIMRGLRTAADVLMPRVCIVCGRRLLADEQHLCLHCTADMPLTRFWTMRHNPMADKFNAVIQKGLDKTDSHPGERYAFAAALFLYREDGDYRRIPHQLKYHGNIAAGRYFGRMLGRRLAESGLFEDADMVVPVPLHWMRRWKRGYNQAEVIASEVASETGAELCTDILVRCRRTQTQTKLGPEEKAANVSGAFAANMKSLHGSDSGSVRHIILVDDVFTTGSTLGECFMALRKVFPPSVRISAATLAYVGQV